MRVRRVPLSILPPRPRRISIGEMIIRQHDSTFKVRVLPGAVVKRKPLRRMPVGRVINKLKYGL